MRRLLVSALTTLCTIAVGTIAFAQPSPPPDPSKIQVLILTGQHVHDWRNTTPILKQILESTGKFEVRVNEEFRGAGPETLAPYDLVVVNYYNRGDKDRWGDRANGALEAFVRSGKGVVLYHLALGAFDGWTEYEKMSGGNWRPNNGHHSARHDFTVDIKDTDHPITRGLKSFPRHDRRALRQFALAARGQLSCAGHRLRRPRALQRKGTPADSRCRHSSADIVDDAVRSRPCIRDDARSRTGRSARAGIRDDIRARGGMGRDRQGHAACSVGAREIDAT